MDMVLSWYLDLFFTFLLKAMLEQMFQLENISASEEAWRRLNPTLHCGPDKMKLRAMGAGASHLKLDMGIQTQPSVYNFSL